jgi:glucose/arabinose dehydrogenase
MTIATPAVFASFALVLAGLSAPQAQVAPQAPAAPIPRVTFSRVLPELELRRPVQVVFEPGSDEYMYILEQPGRVVRAKPGASDTKAAEVVLDIRERVNSRGNEEGLLSMAFHPKVAQNRQVFLYYTAMDGARKRVSRLSRFTFDPAAGVIMPDSEQVVLQVDQPYSNHNGGTVLFGPDGMLYLSLGDGGAANDPLNAGQDLGTLLAKVLRLDVDTPSEGKLYSVPKDNPFVGTSGARPEVWAYGLRNVWRMSFDRTTGELYGGDVGQNAYEEVDVIRKGGNYGWNPREGKHEFDGGKPGKFGSDYLEPIAEYPRSQGVSITGGYVYRGEALPALNGVYLYADLVSCRVWGLRAKDGALTAGPIEVGRTRGQLPTSFGEANDGTLYLVTFDGSQDSTAKGGVWRIGVAGGTSSAAPAPAK